MLTSINSTVSKKSVAAKQCVANMQFSRTNAEQLSPVSTRLKPKKARLDKAVDNIRPPVLPAPISPVFHPAQAAKQRRANEEAMQRARQMQAQKEEKLRLQADQIRRGQQAQREEISRLKAKAEERQENFRKLQSETKNIVSNEAARIQKAAEEKRDAQLKAAHEKKMAEENARVQRLLRPRNKSESLVRRLKSWLVRRHWLKQMLSEQPKRSEPVLKCYGTRIKLSETSDKYLSASRRWKCCSVKSQWRCPTQRCRTLK